MRYHGNRNSNGNAPAAGLVALDAFAGLSASAAPYRRLWDLSPQCPQCQLQLCGSALNVDFVLHPRRWYAASDTGSTQWCLVSVVVLLVGHCQCHAKGVRQRRRLRLWLQKSQQHRPPSRPSGQFWTVLLLILLPSAECRIPNSDTDINAL